MKRTKTTNVPEGQVQFVKKGKGMLRLKNGQVVKENEFFYAYPEDIPNAFRDSVVPTNPDKAVKETFKEHGVIEDKKPVYKMKPAEAESGDKEKLFDIVDKQDKKINEDRLTRKDAIALLKDLNPR